MLFDIRCLQLTVRRNLAVQPKNIALQHFDGCHCNMNQVVITHVGAFVINTPQAVNFCPSCGLATHKGMCRDAIREAKGLQAVKWRA